MGAGLESRYRRVGPRIGAAVRSRYGRGVTEPARTDFPGCYRHPDKRGGVICQRCDRPICPQCMTPATVGFHCPECLSNRAGRHGRGGRQEKIRTVVPGRWVDTKPRATQTFIGLSLAGFIYSQMTGGSLMQVGANALVDGSLFSWQVILHGGQWQIVGVDAGEYYRLVTHAFLHDGILHLGFNLYALWILGVLLEHLLGRVRFIALYLVAMLGGAFGVLLVSPNQPTLGASGAVFGLMGALLLAQRSVGISVWRTPLMPVLALNLALTLMIPRISVGGHGGGLVTGAAVGWLILMLTRRRAPDWLITVLVGVLAVAIVAGSVWAAARWHDPIF